MQAQGEDLHDPRQQQTAQDFSDQLWSRIEQQIINTEKPVVKMASRRRVWPVAAAVTIALGSAALLFYLGKFDRTLSSPDIAVQYPVKPQPNSPDVKPKMTTVSNLSNQPMELSLSDGSSIKLYPQAEIVYPSSFTAANRTITLKGKAFFQVKKDPTKPFIVTSGNFSTTALGTSFTITAIKDEPNINIELHTGKVVVKQVHNKYNHWKDVFLSPGESLHCDLATGKTKRVNSASIARRKLSIDKNSGEPCRSGFSASFQRTPLTEVFEQIQQGYGIKISYDANALTNIQYTGAIQSTDCLQQVLHRIAVLHQLTILQNGNNYQIRFN